MLLRVYANCLDGDEAMANQRISGALSRAIMPPTLNASRPVLGATADDVIW